MFGLGLSEILIIGILALIFIGPKELPQVARTIAKFINEMRRTADSFKRELNQVNPINEVKSKILDETSNRPPKEAKDDSEPR